MKFKNTLFILAIFLFCSCSVGPEPIDYGKEACHFCKMNIVDNQHAAELVSKKGKAFKYDALECMLNEMKTFELNDIALFLTNTYDYPGELVAAEGATYLINESMPSPMGANLNAFKDKKKAELIKNQKGGIMLSWNELNSKFLSE